MNEIMNVVAENFWLIFLAILLLLTNKKYRMIAPLLIAIKLFFDGDIVTGSMGIILPLWMFLSFWICRDYYKSNYKKSLRDLRLYLNAMDLKDLKIDDLNTYQQIDDLRKEIFNIIKTKIIREIKQIELENEIK